MKGQFLKDGDVVILTEEHNVGALGKYVVYKTAKTGGGTGHGPHDVYPDGHKVYCESIFNSNDRVEFYQSGCFTNTITPDQIQPVGKARRSWTVIEYNG